MKNNNIYSQYIDCNNEDEVFEYLLQNLKPSNRTWDYFINWEKVLTNIEDIEINLNILNYIVGKENIEESLFYLIKKYPSIIKAFPYLLASRDKNFTILHKYDFNEFIYKEYSFKKNNSLTDKEIYLSIEFLKCSGFLELIKTKRIKNLVDYVIGTETGLDTNGRKNRSGHIMEDIVEYFIKNICIENNWVYLREATAAKIIDNWGIELPVVKTSRRLDFVIKTNKSIYLIETNYYGGSGSKLKSTAKEYQGIAKYWNNHGFKFLWITDGKGWELSKSALNEAFKDLDYVLNLEMVKNNILEEILKNDL